MAKRKVTVTQALQRAVRLKEALQKSFDTSLLTAWLAERLGAICDANTLVPEDATSVVGVALMVEKTKLCAEYVQTHLNL